MKNKMIALCLVVSMLAVAVVSGTMAYLTDTESAVNVMTVGNVSIEQHEYERVVKSDGSFATDTIDNQTSYVLQGFTQAKPLLPSALDTTTWQDWDWESTIVRMTQVDSYGSMQVFKAASNAQDKFVTVENTGKSDAYIRTLVAIECGEGSAELIGVSYHNTWEKTPIGVIEVDNNKYYLFVYIYKGGQLSDGTWRHGNGILPAGDTSYPSFSQVYIKSEATNEDMTALDGNGNGTLDILVLSQAVQAAGFETAEAALNAGFGEITTTNNPWLTDGVTTNAPAIPVVVDTADALADAMENGGTIVLSDDLVVAEKLSIAKDKAVTLDLAGNTLSGAFNNQGASALVENKGTLTIKNGTVVSLAEFPDVDWGTEGFPTYATNTISNRGTLVIGEGAVIENQTNVGGASYAIDNYSGATLIVNDGAVVKAQDVAIRMFSGSATAENKVVINGGTITGKRAVWVQLPSSNASVAPLTTLEINGGDLKSSSDWTIYSYSYGNSFANTNVTITGGTFEKIVAFGGGYQGDQENVTVTGGVFNGDLGRYLANDGWEDIAKPQ